MGTDRLANESLTVPSRSAPQRAIMLAAGKGSRLRPHTGDCPKPLLTLQGRPLIDWTLTALRDAGVSEAILIVHYLAGQIMHYCGDGRRWQMSLEYRWQSQLSGTATALQCAADRLDRPVWVVAADYALQAAGLLEIKQVYEHSSADAVVSLKSLSQAEMIMRSQVLFDAQARISRIIEKPAAMQASDGWGASLLYIVPPDTARCLDDVRTGAGGERHLASAVNALLAQGLEVRGVKQAAPREWKLSDPDAGPCVTNAQQ